MRWIWLLGLFACGDNVVPRLAPVQYDIAGTVFTVASTFHDRARAEDCVPVTWADAATYCTPAYGDAAYTDPICTKPIARTADMPSGYVGTFFTLNGLTSLRRLHAVQGEIAPPVQFWLQHGSSCDGPFTGDATYHYAAVGPELDERAFVRLRRSAPEGAGRVQLVAWTTDDGLHVPAGFHDRTLKADCTLSAHTDAESARCEPDAQPANSFTDAACTAPAVETPGSPPAFGWYSTGSGCRTFAPVTTEVIDGSLYSPTGSGCMKITLPDGWREFALGDPVELATLARERGPGTRIQPVTLAVQGLRTPDDVVHDTQLDADCRPGLLAATMRCVPPARTSVVSYFVDDQCITAVDVTLVAEGTCDPAPRYAFRPEAFHAIGAAVTTQLYEVSTGDRCVPYAPSPPFVAHEVGPPLPLETFAEANVRY